MGKGRRGGVQLFMDDGIMVELRFKYSRDEYIKAERQYLFASKTISKTSVVVLVIFVPASIANLFYSSFSVPGVIFAMAAVIFVAFGGALYFYLPSYKYKQTAKYHEVYALTFSEDCIKFKTPSIDSELKWSVYSELWENDDFYFLIQAPRQYALIPKRTFACPDDERRFNEIARANISKFLLLKKQ
jgi:hypothetical protein